VERRLSIAAVIAAPQITEPVNRETVLVFNTLFCQPLDMPREVAPRSKVQLMPGHDAVNVDRTRDRFGDMFDGRHVGQRAA
jgi:hypothetical protein